MQLALPEERPTLPDGLVARIRASREGFRQCLQALLRGEREPLPGGYLTPRGWQAVVNLAPAVLVEVLRQEFSKAQRTGDWRRYCLLEMEAAVQACSLALVLARWHQDAQ